MSIQICVIDDESINNFITTKMLKKHDPDCHVKSFEFAALAIEHLNKCQINNDLPHLILLDISMPGMDGWQFLDQLDFLTIDPGFSIKIYILSSTLQESERIKALSHKRISGFYRKPLTAESVQNIFNGNLFK